MFLKSNCNLISGFSIDFIIQVREVEMGPFKHEVDDGLDLRKAAFECMYTLLDTCVDRLDVFEFLSHVQDGLKDHYDIKVNLKMILFFVWGPLYILMPDCMEKV